MTKAVLALASILACASCESQPRRSAGRTGGGSIDAGSRSEDPTRDAGPAVMPEWVPTFRGLEMMRTEVTVQAFRECVDAGPCAGSFAAHDSGFMTEFCNWDRPGREAHPMNCVTWAGADAFCRWAGARLPTGNEWRLEATNAGQSKYPWGDWGPSCMTAVMRVVGVEYPQSLGCGGLGTSEPCSRPDGASVGGVCDMIGNVAEWAGEPPGDFGSANALGGGFGSAECGDPGPEPACRSDLDPNWARSLVATQQDHDTGFRCVR